MSRFQHIPPFPAHPSFSSSGSPTAFDSHSHSHSPYSHWKGGPPVNSALSQPQLHSHSHSHLHSHSHSHSSEAQPPSTSSNSQTPTSASTSTPTRNPTQTQTQTQTQMYSVSDPNSYRNAHSVPPSASIVIPSPPPPPSNSSSNAASSSSSSSRSSSSSSASASASTNFSSSQSFQSAPTYYNAPVVINHYIVNSSHGPPGDPSAHLSHLPHPPPLPMPPSFPPAPYSNPLSQQRSLPDALAEAKKAADVLRQNPNDLATAQHHLMASLSFTKPLARMWGMGGAGGFGLGSELGKSGNTTHDEFARMIREEQEQAERMRTQSNTGGTLEALPKASISTPPQSHFSSQPPEYPAPHHAEHSYSPSRTSVLRSDHPSSSFPASLTPVASRYGHQIATTNNNNVEKTITDFETLAGQIRIRAKLSDSQSPPLAPVSTRAVQSQAFFGSRSKSSSPSHANSAPTSFAPNSSSSSLFSHLPSVSPSSSTSSSSSKSTKLPAEAAKDDCTVSTEKPPISAEQRKEEVAQGEEEDEGDKDEREEKVSTKTKEVVVLNPDEDGADSDSSEVHRHDGEPPRDKYGELERERKHSQLSKPPSSTSSFSSTSYGSHLSSQSPIPSLASQALTSSSCSTEDGDLSRRGSTRTRRPPAAIYSTNSNERELLDIAKRASLKSQSEKRRNERDAKGSVASLRRRKAEERKKAAACAASDPERQEEEEIKEEEDNHEEEKEEKSSNSASQSSPKPKPPQRRRKGLRFGNKKRLSNATRSSSADQAHQALTQGKQSERENEDDDIRVGEDEANVEENEENVDQDQSEEEHQVATTKPRRRTDRQFFESSASITFDKSSIPSASPQSGVTHPSKPDLNKSSKPAKKFSAGVSPSSSPSSASKDNFSPAESECILLQDWYPFIFYSVPHASTPTPYRVRLRGRLHDHPQHLAWSSGIITGRKDNRSLVSSSGRVYMLMGPLAKGEDVARCLSEKFRLEFQDGFPEDWKEKLAKELARLIKDQNPNVLPPSSTSISSSPSSSTLTKKTKLKQTLQSERIEEIENDKGKAAEEAELEETEYNENTRPPKKSGARSTNSRSKKVTKSSSSSKSHKSSSTTASTTSASSSLSSTTSSFPKPSSSSLSALPSSSAEYAIDLRSVAKTFTRSGRPVIKPLNQFEGERVINGVIVKGNSLEPYLSFIQKQSQIVPADAEHLHSNKESAATITVTTSNNTTSSNSSRKHEVDSDGWGAEEYERLVHAVSITSPLNTSFWLDIARHVFTKSAEQCQRKYSQAFPTPVKKKPDIKSKPTAISRQFPTNGSNSSSSTSSKPETKKPRLTKKKKLQAWLQERDNQYEGDDVFESTPFKKLRTQSKSNELEQEDEGDEDEEDNDDEEEEEEEDEMDENEHAEKAGADDEDANLDLPEVDRNASAAYIQHVKAQDKLNSRTSSLARTKSTSRSSSKKNASSQASSTSSSAADVGLVAGKRKRFSHVNEEAGKVFRIIERAQERRLEEDEEEEHGEWSNEEPLTDEN